MSSASVDGAAIAAPTPCTARAASSQVGRLRRAARERREREEGDAEDEHAPAAEEVAGACAEQEQAAEGQRVGVLHPREAGGEKPSAWWMLGRAVMTIEMSSTIIR